MYEWIEFTNDPLVARYIISETNRIDADIELHDNCYVATIYRSTPPYLCVPFVNLGEAKRYIERKLNG